MKRKLLSVFLLLVLCLSLAVPVCVAQEQMLTGENVLFDDADLLTREEETELNRKLMRISESHNAQIVVVTVSSSAVGNVDYYVEYLYDTMGFGCGVNHDGVLLLVCMNPREYRILSNGFAADAIRSREIDAIGDSIVSDLSDGDYADAFDEFANRCEYYLNGHLNGFPFNAGKNMIIALGVGAVMGLIVALVLKSQLKSVRKQNYAAVYVKPNSMHVTVHRDIFLYRNISRTRRESGSSSRSGSSRSGSSRNVGGGSF